MNLSPGATEPQRVHVMFRDPVQNEIRHDKPYDEQTPGHAVHWNGSLIACWDRELMGALTKAVIEHYDQERAKAEPIAD